MGQDVTAIQCSAASVVLAEAARAVSESAAACTTPRRCQGTATSDSVTRSHLRPSLTLPNH